ncbi:Ig-like domain-containing protein [Gracilibacillus caseinilyticus]|uniref:Ig-like domain-containing protein n=1 Tax=Gracilibacillus caseinilyticus TaxID=2932256 RepID=A0ABY4EVM8_9BACI|nr:immunoglobulin-like domain-containing protein [Gracilibacillus caseinilyticus]UOQ48444.1 Ig-like domain-containing protein [Gracilibacillus caseinilyticus]
MQTSFTKKPWCLLILLILLTVTGSIIGMQQSQAEVVTKTITIDGENVDPHNRFKGFGTVSGNNTSRLLLDYKEEHPDQYWEIMNQLFNKDTGAGLTHVKVELGADINSSSGTEPATMRFEDEPANVLRGAGFQFAADAKSINPDITTEILRWGEPRWTWESAANHEYEDRYQWYKQTIDAVYEEYGFKLDYIGISQNERAQNGNGRNEVEWLKYFTTHIKDEPNYEADYQDIKLVAADGYRDTATISRTLLDNPDLIDEIDVISSHYGLTGSTELNTLQEQLKEEGKKPKEVWVSEGISPMINARYRDNMEPDYNGLGGRAGIIDVTSRIISVYSWEGANDQPLNAVSFDFQPSVAAFYQGAQYNPKQLISAFDPWSGFYEADGGIQGVRHVMNFTEHDDLSTGKNERWQYVQDATFSDGDFFDGGVDVDTSTHNYMTLKDPETDDYTTVFANNTNDTRSYTIEAKNLSGKENAEVFVWETKGPSEGEAYDANWFKNVDVIQPEEGVYQVEVKPYSIVTITTLDKAAEIDGFEYQSDPVDLAEDTIMSLPYSDDFEYDEYPLDEQDRDYVDRRGGTPRYTTDQIGAFEVVKQATKQAEDGSFEKEPLDIPEAEAHGNMLQQKMTTDIIGADWAVWGGTDGAAADVNPNTNIGDFRWVNYKASFDFLLDTHTETVQGRDNYALIGVRQVKAGWSDSQATYNAKIFADGKYEISKMGSVVKQGTTEGFDNSVWHRLAFEAKENVFTLYLDGEPIATYTDEDATVMAGRVTLGTGYYETLIDNLSIEPIEGYPYKSLKVDNAQGQIYRSEGAALNNEDEWNPIGYVGDWEFMQSGYAHFNRTQMTTSSDYPVWNGYLVEHTDTTSEQGTLHKVFYSGDWGSNSSNAWGNDGDSFEITFEGNAIRLYGETNPNNGTADVYLDGELVGEANYLNNSSIVKEVWSAEDLEDTEHTLKVVSKESYTSFVKAEIDTDKPIDAESVTTLAPNDFTAITEDAEIGSQENTVYAYRENGNTWGANDNNAWANFNDNPYIYIHFTGTGIDYLAGSDNATTYQFELDGEVAGNYDVGEDGIRYSVRDLEDKEHTLKVSLGDNEVKETYMDYRGVNIYSTPEQSDNKLIFDFEGSGFNLFGATPDALMDVYIDGEQIEQDYRVDAKGDRQTFYHIRGLDVEQHTAEIVVKGGGLTLDGMDVISEASTSDDTDPDEPTEPLEDQLLAHYDMSVSGDHLIDITENEMDASLVGFTSEDVKQEDGVKVLPFAGDESKYVSLPKGLITDESFTIETTFKTSTGANHWLYSIGTKQGNWPNVNNYIFLNPNQADNTVRFGIKDEETELLFQDASISTEEYNTFTAAFEEGNISLYLNDVPVGSIQHDYIVQNILKNGVTDGEDFIGYIGKSLYNTDPPFEGILKDFKVYNYTLSEQEITGYSDQELVEQAKAELSLESEVTKDLSLPNQVKVNGLTADVSWESNNETYLSKEGSVTRPAYDEGDQEVVLTATITIGESTAKKEFTITVKRLPQDTDLLKEAAAALKVYNINDVRGNITLPTEGENGTVISWKSEDESMISNTGEVTRPANGKGDEEVNLKATITLNDQTIIKSFVANVKELPKEKDYKGYLFSYFTGESTADGEQIYFALSEGNDPLHWQELNNGEPVITSDMGEKGLRDPFIIRSPEGDKFYMIATDLKIHGNGDWGRAQTEGSRSIMVWESTDLINWSEQRMVEVAPKEAGNTWAPEIFYDKSIGKYVIFWASKLYDSEENRNSGDSYQRMMYTTTRDFHTFSEPEIYLDYGYSVIDTTMIEDAGKIYRFTKDERGNDPENAPNGKFILQESGDSVLDPNFELITEGIGKGTISQGEGPAIFKSNTEDKWYLFIDEFGGRGYIPFETTDLASGEWRISEEYDLPDSPRHGTVLPVTQEEYDALLENIPSEIENDVVSVNGISVEQSEVTLATGEEASINVKVEPADAANQNVWYSSNNPEVVSVTEDGVMKAVGEGGALVTVTSADGGYTAVVSVTVLDKEEPEPPVVDTELTLGQSQKVFAGENYTINGISARIKMPEDLPAGTMITVHPLEVKDTNYAELMIAGEAFDVEMEYPDHATEPTGEFTIFLGYQTGADTDEIAIYYYNASEDIWEHVGGNTDEENQVISLNVSHFSSYGVFAEAAEDTSDEDNSDNEADSNDNTDQSSEDEEASDQQSTDQTSDENEKGETGSDQHDKQESTEKENKSDEQLPNTATNIFSYLGASIIFLLIGVAIIVIRRKAVK